MSDDIPKGIRIIHRREKIRAVTEAWRKQYGHGHYANDPGKQSTQAKLDALDLETCSADDVAAAIGNRTWTDEDCDVCGEGNFEQMAQIGEMPDYGARWVTICFPCLAQIGEWAGRKSAT